MPAALVPVGAGAGVIEGPFEGELDATMVGFEVGEMGPFGATGCGVNVAVGVPEQPTERETIASTKVVNAILDDTFM